MDLMANVRRTISIRLYSSSRSTQTRARAELGHESWANKMREDKYEEEVEVDEKNVTRKVQK